MMTIRIRKHEVGLWFRHGDLRGLLEPGAHRFWGRFVFPGRDRIEVIDTLRTQFEHPMLDMLLRDAAVFDRLEVVDLDDDQRALLWIDGRLAHILGRGRHAFWKAPRRLKVEIFNVEAFRFAHPKIETVIEHAGAARHFEGVRVEAHERVLLYRDGVLVENLGPGMHVFWKGAGRIHWRSVDLREKVADVAGQEIMTADKVTLRVNLMLSHRVTDPVRAVEVVDDADQALYRAAQLALREAVGARTLDRMLADKDAVGAEVRAALSKRAAEFGQKVYAVGLRDVILPGDMKEILNQVITAQKQAEANQIRRREETAAVRSQLNTARLMAEHPALARMKELEALQEILTGADTRFVFGAGDVSDQVRKLLDRKED